MGKLAKLMAFGRYPEYLDALVWRIVVPWRLRRRGVLVDPTARFLGAPIVSLSDASIVRIGPRCVMCSDSRYTALGVNHPVVLRTLQRGASIEIGADSGLSGTVICAATRIEIGREVLLGANSVIVDTDFHPLVPDRRRYNSDFERVKAAPVRIDDNVFVGMGAVILKGVTIGRSSVVGACSVVTRDVPPGVIVAGSPARIVGRVDDQREFEVQSQRAADAAKTGE